MKSIRTITDENGGIDIYLSNGKAEIIDGKNELAQSLKFEIESNLKQWFLGTSFGAAWLQDDGSGLFDTKGVDLSEFEAEVLRVVYKRKDVANATVASSSISNDRKISMTIDLYTIYGESITFTINPS